MAATLRADRGDQVLIPVRSRSAKVRAFRRAKVDEWLGRDTRSGQLVLSDLYGRDLAELPVYVQPGPAAGERSEPLLTNKKSVDTPERSKESKARQAMLYRLQRTSVEFKSPNGPKALQHCHHKTGYESGPDGTRRKRARVQVRVKESGRASFGGILRCGSVWCCPLCGQKISMERTDELRAVVQRHLDSGAGAYMVTLTPRHDIHDRLKPLRQAVTGALRKLRQSRTWRGTKKHPTGIKQRYGIIGDVRALEVTIGTRAGWHPHLHLLVFTHAPATAELAAQLEDELFPTWSDEIAKALGEDNRPLRRGEDGESLGVHVEAVSSSEIGRYVAKFGIAAELTMSATKGGRAGNRSIWQLLSDLHANSTELKTQRQLQGGDRQYQRELQHLVDRDGRLWWEWSEGMKGARQLFWTPALRQHFGLQPELDDEEIVYLHDDQGEIVAEIDAPVFEFFSKVKGWLFYVLLIAEEDGGSGVLQFIDRCRNEFTDRSKPPPWWAENQRGKNGREIN